MRRNLDRIELDQLDEVVDLRRHSYKVPNFLRYLRQESGRSQAEIATLLTIHQANYQRRERGLIDFSIDEIELLAQIYFENGMFGFWKELQAYVPFTP